MKLLLGLLIAAILGASCSAQSIRVEVVSEPSVANEKGELVPISKARNLSLGSASANTNYVEVMSADAVYSQLQLLYRYCPGLVSAFENMRAAPALRMNELEGFESFNKALDDVLHYRNDFLEEAKALGNGSIFLQTKFVDRVLKVERESDERLGEIFSELVPPSRVPAFIVGVQPGCDNNLLTSHFFREHAQISKADFSKRWDAGRNFLEWAVKNAYVEQKNLDAGREKLRLMYQDLTIQQFLELKVLLGQSKPGESIEQYMAHSREKKLESAYFVTAVVEALK